MYVQNSANLLQKFNQDLDDGSDEYVTPIVDLEEMAKEYKVGKVLIKDESKNSYGTYKDRRSKSIVKFAKEGLYDKIVIITAGNAGYSLLKACEGTSIRLINVVDKSTSDRIKKKLMSTASQVLEVDLNKTVLSSKDLKNLVSTKSHDRILDASNGFHEAYESIYYEVACENVDYIVVPFGSGEAFFGIISAISKSNSKTRVIGVGVENRSGSCANKLRCIWTPYENKLQSVLKKGHRLIRLNEEEIQQAYKISSKFIDCELSSSVVFGVFKRIRFSENDRILLVNSGRGLL
ncbi:threonine synthase [Acetivibrio thermocellus AD2]|uniref:Threonine synthase n=2 Tax=Acetivibrio thermocellus TaxID=1515 RepID=A0AB36TM49_ACETH|nr:Pyridoxal-5'-phosphate-dependent protein beta subunit [Acetivibrio thermocellus DSM 1313]ALX09569.1 Pyridoxal-5'-phosphate-dependent protein beta subunit [Acetivibrio thermocellus AD2]ANV77341.1 Pyridoxal-5'-phosphate-dependent protein beta subunit [Acetivibrio thermocellus DSM 2360]EIC04442.1 Pyridoxal-5'-phosphate-dependent protein beta subunit [Acetivibrio thermocellus YS]THJ76742.1 PLP-dependent lyase/thiolase [Acetivibrio thermocellus]CDG36419.1 Pyridoxal-5'-phosphate-dependent protein